MITWYCVQFCAVSFNTNRYSPEPNSFHPVASPNSLVCHVQVNPSAHEALNTESFLIPLVFTHALNTYFFPALLAGIGTVSVNHINSPDCRPTGALIFSEEVPLFAVAVVTPEPGKFVNPSFPPLGAIQYCHPESASTNPFQFCPAQAPARPT